MGIKDGININMEKTILNNDLQKVDKLTEQDEFVDNDGVLIEDHVLIEDAETKQVLTNRRG